MAKQISEVYSSIKLKLRSTLFVASVCSLLQCSSLDFSQAQSSAQSSSTKDDQIFYQVLAGEVAFTQDTNTIATSPAGYSAQAGEVFRAGPEGPGGMHEVNIRGSRSIPQRRLYFKPPDASQEREVIPIGPALDRAIGFIDVPEGETTVLYRTPGLTPENCTTLFSPCLARPTYGSEVVVRDSRLVSVDDPLTGEPQIKNFYQVEYRQGSGATQKKVMGWVAADTVVMERVLGGPPSSFEQPAKDCDNSTPVGAAASNETVTGIENISRGLESNQRSAMDNFAEQLGPFVGQCIHKPRSPKPDMLPYEDLMRPYYRKLPEPQNLRTPSGRALTKDQLVAIDGLARTLYAEMGEKRCSVVGSQYLMAVAAVTLNRVTSVEQGDRTVEFVHRHDPKRHLITQVISARTSAKSRIHKYSAWNAGDPALNNALCPPAHEDKNFHVRDGNRRPTFSEKRIWDRILKIATQVVLDPDGFKARVPQVTQRFYRSDEQYFAGLTPANPPPLIEQEAVSNPRCMRLFDYPTRRQARR